MDAMTSTSLQPSLDTNYGQRRSNTSKQMEMLVDFAEANPNLALGRLRSRNARQISARLWGDIASRLNTDTYGPRRTSREWCKVWNDLKCRVRAKLTNNNQLSNGTVEGPHTIMRLNEVEERVANIIGHDCGTYLNVAQNPSLLARDTHKDHQEVEVENVEVEYLEVESNESHSASMTSPTPSPPERKTSLPVSPSASGSENDPLASTTTYQAVASTAASTTTYQTVASTAAFQPMATTTTYEWVPLGPVAPAPVASTAAVTSTVASTSAFQPMASTATYEWVHLGPVAPAAVPALQGTTQRRRRRPQRRLRAPTIQTNEPTSASDESRAVLFRIRELRARTDSVIADSMLRNAEAAKAQAEAAKTNAEAALITAQALKSLAESVLQAINAVVHRELQSTGEIMIQTMIYATDYHLKKEPSSVNREQRL